MPLFIRALVLCLFLPVTGLAQKGIQSIHFQQISFAKAMQQSKKTGKLIFVDCYTSWCAPCKWMEQNVFIDDSVYNFYNENFINLKIDMEKGEGIALAKKYNVVSFPTYLFLDENGDVIHRTASRMEATEFLEQGAIATDPFRSFSALQRKYESGDRSNLLLLRYALALEKIDRQRAGKVANELELKITDDELNSETGWEIIKELARSEGDRFGSYFLKHKQYYRNIAGYEAVKSLENRLGMSTMYRLIREKDSTGFLSRLSKMRQDPNKKVQRDVAMLEMGYYLTAGFPELFITTSNKAMNGILEYNDADLSFIARRALYIGKDSKVMLDQALVLARKAVQLNPEEYSNQGTLASICLELGQKEEGLVAASKARALADASTSKIQKLAQALLNKIQALP